MIEIEVVPRIETLGGNAAEGAPLSQHIFTQLIRTLSVQTGVPSP
jgi:hypothetical protein